MTLKEEKGFSLIVTVITIVSIIILVAIAFKPSNKVLDDTEHAKNEAETTMDDDKIKEIINYEVAGIPELIDAEIDIKRIPLSNELKVRNKGIPYGSGWSLYIADRDIEKIDAQMGTKNYYKSYKDIAKSYVVDTSTGEYVRLENDWVFTN